MATDYGTDVAALDGLIDPELIVSEELNVCYALGRRITMPTSALEEIGEIEVYTSIDIEDWLGGDTDQVALDDLRAQALQALSEDRRVDTVKVDVRFADGVLSVAVSGVGSQGPFSFVVSSTDGEAAQIKLGS